METLTEIKPPLDLSGYISVKMVGSQDFKTTFKENMYILYDNCNCQISFYTLTWVTLYIYVEQSRKSEKSTKISTYLKGWDIILI